jgi:hypothetical protein
MKDHLLLNTGGSATPLLWPTNAGPATDSESTFPRFSLGDKVVLITRATAIAHFGKFTRQIVV